MSAHTQDPHPPEKADQVNPDLYTAVKHEVKHEISNIRDNKEPVDPTQSDVLVQKHVNGLVITLFCLVAVILIAAIAVIALHGHH